jgi:hypothetical protein
MITIKRLEEVQNLFDEGKIENFDQLNNLIENKLEHGTDSTGDDTPEGLLDQYYYIEAVNEEGREHSITVFITFEADYIYEENDFGKNVCVGVDIGEMTTVRLLFKVEEI